MPDTSTTIFFAGLAAVVVAARFILKNSPAPSRSEDRAGPRAVTEDMVSVVSVLVPQVDRATIRRDLEETHSVERTSERLLEQAKTKKSGSSLLDKYNVTDDTPAAQEPADESPNWVDDRAAREERFRKQRQEMVLRARKRTLELQQAE